MSMTKDIVTLRKVMYLTLEYYVYIMNISLQLGINSIYTMPYKFVWICSDNIIL